MGNLYNQMDKHLEELPLNIYSPVFKDMLEQLDGELQNVLGNVYEGKFEGGDIKMKTELFQKLVVEVSEIRCIGCSRCDYDKCEIYHALEDVNMAFVSEMPNCPYACDLSKLTPKELRRVEELKKKLKNKNIFYKDGGTKNE